MVTALLGLLAAVAVTRRTAPAERTFAAVSGPTQSLMSVPVPFLGVLLVSRLRRPARVGHDPVHGADGPGAGPAGRGVRRARLRRGDGDRAVDSQRRAGGRTPAWSCSAACWCRASPSWSAPAWACCCGGPSSPAWPPSCCPLGLWALLGAVEAFRPVQAWLTPFPSVQHLLSGEMSPTAWAQWLVVLAIWGVGLNALGVARAMRRRAALEPNRERPLTDRCYACRCGLT